MHWVIQVPALPLWFPKLVFDGVSVQGLCAFVRNCSSKCGLHRGCVRASSVAGCGQLPPFALGRGRCLCDPGSAKHNTRKVCGSGPVGGGLPDEMGDSPFRCLMFLQVCALVGVWWFVGTRPSRFGARLLRPCYWFSHKSCSERSGITCTPRIVIL